MAEDWGATSSASMELTTLLLWTIFQEIVKFSSITSDAIIKAYFIFARHGISEIVISDN
jgi:hypothetical protein